MNNPYLFGAALLAFLLGLAHSVLGELLILRRLVKDQLPRLAGSQDFTQRTLRAVWHTATVALWAFGAILLYFSLSTSSGGSALFVTRTTAVSFLMSSLVMAFGTKGKHPGWVVLLAVALVSWLGTAYDF